MLSPLLLVTVVLVTQAKTIWKHTFMKSNLRLFNHFNNLHEFTTIRKPLYTVVWYDNMYSRKLVNEMHEQKMKTVFIEMEELFDTKRSPFDEINRPMFYKNTKEITNWYDIYSEIYNF